MEVKLRNKVGIRKAHDYHLDGILRTLLEISQILELKPREEEFHLPLEVDHPSSDLAIIVPFLKETADAMKSLCTIVIGLMANAVSEDSPTIDTDAVSFSAAALQKIVIGVELQVDSLLFWTNNLRFVATNGEDNDSSAKQKIEKETSLQLLTDRIKEMNEDWKQVVLALLEEKSVCDTLEQASKIPASLYEIAQNLRANAFDLEIRASHLQVRKILQLSWPRLKTMLTSYRIDTNDNELLALLADVRNTAQNTEWEVIRDKNLKKIFSSTDNTSLTEKHKGKIISHFHTTWQAKVKLKKIDEWLRTLRHAQKNPRKSKFSVGTIREKMEKELQMGNKF